MSKIIFEDDVIYRFGKLKKAKDDWQGDKIEFNTAGDGATKIIAGKWLKEQGIYDSDDFYYGKAVELGIYPRNMNIAICTERPGGKLKLEIENTVIANGNSNKMNGLQDNNFNNAMNISKDHQHYLKAEIDKKEDRIRTLEKLLYEKDLEYRKELEAIRTKIYEKDGEIIKKEVSQARLEQENKYLSEQLKNERESRKEIEKDREELNATLQDDTRTQGTMQLIAAAAPMLGDLLKAFTQRMVQPPMPVGYPNGYLPQGYMPNGYPPTMNGQVPGQMQPPVANIIPMQQPNPNQYDMDSQLY